MYVYLHAVCEEEHGERFSLGALAGVTNVQDIQTTEKGTVRGKNSRLVGEGLGGLIFRLRTSVPTHTAAMTSVE